MSDFGPAPPKINAQDLVITEQDKESLLTGMASYADVLYASYTPCGNLYQKMKTQIDPNWRTPKQVNNLRIEAPTNGLKKGLAKEFKDCVMSNFQFYKKRKVNLDEFNVEFLKNGLEEK